MNIQSVKTMLWDTPQSYPIAHPGILADFQETSPFSEAGSWSTGLISAHSRMGHHVSKAGIQQLLPNLKFFPQATYSIFLWLKQTNKQKKLSSVLWEKWNLLEKLDVCIKAREQRDKGSCHPIFNVDGHRRLCRVIVSRPPVYGHFMNSSRGMFSPQKFVQFPNMICSFRVWPASLLLNLINFSTIKIHEEKHSHWTEYEIHLDNRFPIDSEGLTPFLLIMRSPRVARAPWLWSLGNCIHGGSSQKFPVGSRKAG